MAEHGTRTRYTSGKCRCVECKTAQRDYMRRWHGSPLTAPEPVTAAAWRMAMQRLAEAHPAEFAALLAEAQS